MSCTRFTTFRGCQRGGSSSSTSVVARSCFRWFLRTQGRTGSSSSSPSSSACSRSTVGLMIEECAGKIGEVEFVVSAEEENAGAASAAFDDGVRVASAARAGVVSFPPRSSFPPKSGSSTRPGCALWLVFDTFGKGFVNGQQEYSSSDLEKHLGILDRRTARQSRGQLALASSRSRSGRNPRSTLCA